MANLIITVISIALVAVAALMGAYYGGTAFLDGQVKAQANTIIEQAKQLEAAWLQYRIDHNNNPQIAALTDFVPNYMTAIPVPPSTNVTTRFGGTWTGWGVGARTDDSTMAMPFNWNSNDNTLVTLIANDKICDQLTKLAHGTTATPQDPASGDPFVAGNNLLFDTKFDCFRYTGDIVLLNVFVYKVF